MHNSAFFKFCSLVLLAASAGCGNGSQSSAMSQASAPQSVRLGDLYDQLIGHDATQRSANLALTRSMTLNDYYRQTLTGLSDAPVFIDGIRIDGLASKWRQTAATFAGLQEQYVTVGEYWRARGYSPSVVVTRADFAAMNAAVDSGLRESASLSLGDLTTVPNDCFVDHFDFVTGAWGGTISADSFTKQANAVSAFTTAFGNGKKGPFGDTFSVNHELGNSSATYTATNSKGDTLTTYRTGATPSAANPLGHGPCRFSYTPGSVTD